MANSQPGSEPTGDFVVFRAATTFATVQAEFVEEVLTVADVIPLREAPAGVVGTLDFRHRQIAVFGVHWKFGLPDPPANADCQYIVFRAGAMFTALRVDEVEALATVPRSAFQLLVLPGSGLGLGYLRGVVHIGDRLVPVIDPGQLIPRSVVAATLGRAAG